MLSVNYKSWKIPTVMQVGSVECGNYDESTSKTKYHGQWKNNTFGEVEIRHKKIIVHIIKDFSTSIKTLLFWYLWCIKDNISTIWKDADCLTG